MIGVELNDLVTEAQGWVIIVLLVLIFLTLVVILSHLVKLVRRPVSVEYRSAPIAGTDL